MMNWSFITNYLGDEVESYYWLTPFYVRGIYICFLNLRLNKVG